MATSSTWTGKDRDSESNWGQPLSWGAAIDDATEAATAQVRGEMKTQERHRGSLLGLAVGDAVGTTLEFRPRGTFTPISDMVGGGPFSLPTGAWTDDTSMALCLGASLVQCGGFDARDQMNRYCDWVNLGYMSSIGECFDIGGTVSSALEEYQHTGDPFSGSTDPRSAGNGSLMRLAPVVLFYHPDLEAVDRYAAESSRTTHGAQEAIDGCRIFARVLYNALEGRPKEDVLQVAAPASASPRLAEIAAGGYLVKSEAEVQGTGYVVDSLEAALWCFHTTDSFRDAILAAANLGDDADTTAAICGQIAGAYYGLSGIPEGWRETVMQSAEIIDLADRLFDGGGGAG